MRFAVTSKFAACVGDDSLARGEFFVADHGRIAKNLRQHPSLKNRPDIQAIGLHALLADGAEDIVHQGPGPGGVDGGVRCRGIVSELLFLDRLGRANAFPTGAADRKVIQAGEEERAEASALFVGIFYKLLLQELVGDEILHQLVGGVGGHATYGSAGRSAGRAVAHEERGEGLATRLGVGAARGRTSDQCVLGNGW